MDTQAIAITLLQASAILAALALSVAICGRVVTWVLFGSESGDCENNQRDW